MKSHNGNHFGILLLSPSLVPLFVNAEAHALFSWFCKRSGRHLPTNGNQTQSGLPPHIDRFAHDLLEWHQTYRSHNSPQPTVFSKVVKGISTYLQLRGGVCSMAVASNETYFLITLQLIDENALIPSRPSHSVHPQIPLTPREHEVVRYLALGFTNQVIAENMAISIHTVKDHIKAIRGKTGAKNRTGILAKLRVI